MKTYSATSNSPQCSVTVHDDTNGSETPLRHFVKHSPDGFAFGYGGSGPSELARCILLDFYEVQDEQELPVGYQQFKWDKIATIPEDSPGFMITGDEIRDWASKQVQAIS